MSPEMKQRIVNALKVVGVVVLVLLVVGMAADRMIFTPTDGYASKTSVNALTRKVNSIDDSLTAFRGEVTSSLEGVTTNLGNVAKIVKDLQDKQAAPATNPGPQVNAVPPSARTQISRSENFVMVQLNGKPLKVFNWPPELHVTYLRGLKGADCPSGIAHVEDHAHLQGRPASEKNFHLVCDAG